MAKKRRPTLADLRILKRPQLIGDMPSVRPILDPDDLIPSDWTGKTEEEAVAYRDVLEAKYMRPDLRRFEREVVNAIFELHEHPTYAERRMLMRMGF